MSSKKKTTTWDIDAHTEAKHVILEKYLAAWFPIITRKFGTAIYIDGFAGSGIYPTGANGSPIIALDVAVKHILGIKEHVHFVFIEKDRESVETLSHRIRTEYSSIPDNFHCYTYYGEFETHVNEIIGGLKNQGIQIPPTFTFIDPCGFSGVPMSLIQDIMQYDSCEIFINFMEGFVNRFLSVPGNEVHLDQLYGTTEWRRVQELEQSKRGDFLITLYKQQLKNAGANYIWDFKMINKHGQIEYYLVFGTKSVYGLEKMKEAMWEVDSSGNYYFSDRDDPNQSRIFHFDKNAWVHDAAGMVAKEFTGRTVRERTIWKYVIIKTPYIYRISILKELERKGFIKKVEPRTRDGAFSGNPFITFANQATLF